MLLGHTEGRIEHYNTDMTEEKNVTLFVKAGRSAERLGACLRCQRAHLLARLKGPEIKVVLVNVATPPPEFSTAGFTSVPAVLLSDGTGSDDNAVALLEEKWPSGEVNPELQEEAENVTRDIYPLFCKCMQGGDIAVLQSALQCLDAFLQTRGTRFLMGDDISLLDCRVLPQLHEIRVTIHRIKGHSIADSLRCLWMYLFHAYRRGAFTKSCPTDMEILLDWVAKTGEPKSVIKMPEWLPEVHHGNYHSFNVPNMCVCPPCPAKEEVEPPAQ